MPSKKFDTRLSFNYTKGTQMKGGDLRKIREKLGWTQVNMAKALFVTANTVARWERGERSITDSRALMIRMIVDREQPKRKA